MKSYYDRYWRREEVLSDFPYKWPAIKKFIPKEKHLKLLDFGCGKGYILSEILKQNPTINVAGVDVSRQALSFNKKRFPKKQFKLIKDGGKIPFSDNSFDFITALDVLEHVYDTENAFFELSRVLKKRGKILVTVPYNGLLKRTLTALFFFEDIYTPYTPHIRFYTKNSLSKALKKVGITAKEAGYYGRFFPLSSGMYILAEKK